MVAVSDSAISYRRGALSKSYSTASLSAPITNLCLADTPASESASSGSTSRTEAPLCSTMYETSSARSRKLTGTSTRPWPLTPYIEVISRAELCETTATRSPGPTPSRSRPAAWARASSATRR